MLRNVNFRFSLNGALALILVLLALEEFIVAVYFKK